MSKQGLASISQGRSDMFRLDPTVIRVKDGWNCRDLSAADTQDHIASLALSIAEIGVQEPLTVYWEDGQAWLSDGHCRLAATMHAIQCGAEIKTVPVKSEARHANEADRLFSQIVRNSGKPFSALESARVYRKLVDFGWTQAQIAAKAGISAPRVSQVLELLTMPVTVQEMVSQGKVSAHMALTTVQEHNGAKAVQVLQDAVVVAEQEGKTRASPKHVVGLKKPSALSIVKSCFENASYDDETKKGCTVVVFTDAQMNLLREALKL